MSSQTERKLIEILRAPASASGVPAGSRPDPPLFRDNRDARGAVGTLQCSAGAACPTSTLTRTSPPPAPSPEATRGGGRDRKRAAVSGTPRGSACLRPPCALVWLGSPSRS